MDFTREPIIETVITPKEGCKLVVRSSKTTDQEEYFVDAVEIVSFGHALFFRSTERPKAFLAPASDYEILEVREARMVLKNVGIDRSIKIGGGRDGGQRAAKEAVADKAEASPLTTQESFVSPLKETEEEDATVPAASPETKSDSRLDKKKDRRRHYRRRRGRDETAKEEEGGEEGNESSLRLEEKIELPEPKPLSDKGIETTASSIVSSLLPPPMTLISETIARYKDNALFKGAFFSKEEKKEETEELEEEFFIPLAESLEEKGDSNFFEEIKEESAFQTDFAEETVAEETALEDQIESESTPLAEVPEESTNFASSEEEPSKPLESTQECDIAKNETERASTTEDCIEPLSKEICPIPEKIEE